MATQRPMAWLRIRDGLGKLVEAFDGTWCVDLATRQVYLSPALRELAKVESAVLGVDEARDLFVDEARPRLEDAYRTILAEGHKWTAPLTLRSGASVALGALLMHTPRTGPALLIGHHASSASSRRFDEVGPVGTIVELGAAYATFIDRDGLVHEYVHSKDANHDVPPDKVPGSCVFDRMAPLQAEGARRRIVRAIETGEPYVAERAMPVGREIRTFISKIVPLGDGLCMVVSRDVTEAEGYRDRVRSARYELERLTSAIPGCVYQYRRWPDGTDTWLFVSRGSFDIWGLTPEELMAQPALAWRALHPDDAPGFLEKVLASQRTLTRFDIEARLVQGERVRWVRAQSSPEGPFRDGSVTWTGVVQDVTALKEAEAQRKAMEMQMLRTQKLESLGLLAGGIAHDFNNLLVGVLGNTGMLLEDLPDDPDLRHLAEQIDQAARKMAAMTRQMLAYSGRSKMTVERSDLNQAVEEVMSLVRAAISKSVRLELARASDAIVVEMESSQVTQIVMNLVINGAEAIGEATGTVSVDTSVVVAGPEDFRDTPWASELVAGRYARIRVRDTGSGMTATTKARIFDPFFSTKFTGRGLGLAAVLGILRSHRGAVNVDSAPGRGTSFDVYFPLSELGLDPALVKDGTSARAKPRGRVLIVDDEAIVRAAATRVLEQEGLEVVAVEGARQALGLLETKGARVDVVLLDATMPGMDGPEAFRHIRVLRPDLPVVFMSGYSEQEIEATTGGGAAGFLAKPFTPQELREKIAHALRAGGGEGRNGGLLRVGSAV